MAKGKIEAMTQSLTNRGEVYRLNEKEFPPGAWVEVTEGEAFWLACRGDKFQLRGDMGKRH